jgi:Alginate export
MKKMLTILLAVSMIALVAMPAFAEVQNIKVSGGIIMTGMNRDNFVNRGAGAAYTDSGTRDFYNTATTLGVAADLTDNVSATMLLGNERDWGVSAGNQNIIAMESYITMKELLYSALTVKAGRMSLGIADSLVVGDGTSTTNLITDDLSNQTQWDAIAGILDYDPLTVIMGTAKVSDEAQTSTDDQDLYFVDGIYKFGDDMNTVLDAYFATKHSSSTGAGVKGLDVNVLAAVLNLEPVERVSAKLGLAMQNGDYNATRKLDAMSFDLGLNYAIDNEYAPVVGVKYLYRSGDDQATGSADYTGWLPLYENQINGQIYDVNTNTNAIALTLSAAPVDRLTVGLDYWMFLLDESLKTATATNSTSDEAGSELDLTASYAYTEDVNLGACLAWFFPGDYYKSGSDETAMQAMVQVGVKF